jgi:hypothetical protein
MIRKRIIEDEVRSVSDNSKHIDWDRLGYGESVLSSVPMHSIDQLGKNRR